MKAMARCYLTPVRGMGHGKCWWGGGAYALSLESGLMWPLWRTVWRFFRELGMELPCGPEVPFPDVCLKETGSLSQRILHPHVHSSIA